MDTQLTVSGSQNISLTPFEEAVMRAIKFGLALESCQELKAFVDIIEDAESVESKWLEKVYITELLKYKEPDFN